MLQEPNEEILKEAMENPMEAPASVDQIIQDILALSREGKKELTQKVRTTPEGIQAYTSFLYGLSYGQKEDSAN